MAGRRHHQQQPGNLQISPGFDQTDSCLSHGSIVQELLQAGRVDFAQDFFGMQACHRVPSGALNPETVTLKASISIPPAMEGSNFGGTQRMVASLASCQTSAVHLPKLAHQLDVTHVSSSVFQGMS